MLSASASGAVAYGVAGISRSQWTWVDRSGKPQSTIAVVESAPYGNPSLSPDGRKLAVNRLVNGNWDIWLLDLERSVFSRATDQPGLDFFPLWTRDGQRLIFSSTRGERSALYSRNQDGSNDALILPIEGLRPTDVSADGRFLLFDRNDPETGSDIWVLPLDREAQPRVVIQRAGSQRDGQFSPDGNWIAYRTNETGRSEIYLQPFAAPGEKVPVSKDGGTHVRWRPHGNEIFYVGLNGQMMQALLKPSPDGKSLSVSSTEVLFAAPGSWVLADMRPPYVVASDGRRFLTPVAMEATPPATVVVSLNWNAPRQ